MNGGGDLADVDGRNIEHRAEGAFFHDIGVLVSCIYDHSAFFFQITDSVFASDLHFALQAEEQLDICMGHISQG